MRDYMKLFEELDVILKGHFLLTSGKHSPLFLQCSQLMKHPEYTEEAMKELAKRFAGTEAEYVVGPAMGGIIPAYELARQLGIQCMYAEKTEDNKMEFKRGFYAKPGTKVLVVEDALSTGGSVQKVIDACLEVGLEVVGVGIIVDRSNGRVRLHEKQESLITLDVPAYEANDCPLCKAGIPLQKPKAGFNRK